jgi:hypothetical protein
LALAALWLPEWSKEPFELLTLRVPMAGSSMVSSQPRPNAGGDTDGSSEEEVRDDTDAIRATPSLPSREGRRVAHPVLALAPPEWRGGGRTWLSLDAGLCLWVGVP